MSKSPKLDNFKIVLCLLHVLSCYILGYSRYRRFGDEKWHNEWKKQEDQLLFTSRRVLQATRRDMEGIKSISSLPHSCRRLKASHHEIWRNY